MAVGQTTTTQIDSAVTNWYDRVLLRRALPYLAHGLFGQKRPLPSKSGTTIKFRRYTALNKATVPLVEGVTPTAEQLAKTDVTATPLSYGQYVEISDEIDMTTEDRVLNEAGVLLGESAGETIDTIYREILNAGTSVSYAGGVAGKVNVITKVSTTDLDKALRTLRNNKAKYFTKSIKGGTGVGTQPIRASYYAVIHPNVTYDIEGLTGFVSVANYPNPETAHENEIGAYKNIRFIESTEAKYTVGASGVTSAVGSSGLDATSTYVNVYHILIFGMDAYGIVDLKGHAMQNIIKPYGSGDDPLNQRATSGWKAKTTCVILNDNFMHRLEVGATA
jgi:N4-gp56 family major capsid protein